MADELDRASDIGMAERDYALARARNHAAMPPVCACYNCGEALPPGRLFCDRDCRDDYEKRTRQL